MKVIIKTLLIELCITSTFPKGSSAKLLDEDEQFFLLLGITHIKNVYINESLYL